MGGGRSLVQKPSSTPVKRELKGKLLTSSWTRFLAIIGKYANERPTRSERGKSNSKRATGETGSSLGSLGAARAPRRRTTSPGPPRRLCSIVSRPRRGRSGGAPRGPAPAGPQPPPLPRGPGRSVPRCCLFRRRLQARWSAGSPRRGARSPPQPPLAPRRGEAARSRVPRGAPIARGRAAGFVP